MLTFSSDPYNQMRAVIYYLVAFSYADSDFDTSERSFVQEHIRRLVDERVRTANLDERVREGVLRHFEEVLHEIDHTIRGYFTESVGLGETTSQFVLAKLKLGCLELFKRLDEDGQRTLLTAIEGLILADGVAHPAKAAFRDEIVRLLRAEEEELEETELEPIEEGSVIIDAIRELASRIDDHPFLSQLEWDFAPDPTVFAEQSRGELKLVERVIGLLARLRAEGSGRLAAAKDLSSFAPGARFLDGHVHVLAPAPTSACELLVLGDLHGCYSCFKAALLQGDFFGKLQAHREDPVRHPPVYLVLLGDYIDRGRFSMSGTLRMAMQLLTRFPENVYMLRGNHEYYLDLDGRVVAPVRPCEALDSITELAGDAANDVLARYMEMFESLPAMLAVGSTLFVHGGIPRSDTLRDKWRGVASLNDPEIRFQMMWSDPSEIDVVPAELQQESARFPFGRRQFHQFMGRLGCKTMVRGHERVTEGFRRVFHDPEGILLTLFSAGGESNQDLPEESSFREVTPMALSVRIQNGVSTFLPFPIEYARYNDPRYNGFFQAEVDADDLDADDQP